MWIECKNQNKASDKVFSDISDIILEKKMGNADTLQGFIDEQLKSWPSCKADITGLTP